MIDVDDFIKTKIRYRSVIRSNPHYTEKRATVARVEVAFSTERMEKI
jgi:hypothetical protein